MSDQIKAVYDCMVLLQAAARPDRVHGTMRLIQDGRVTLCFSEATIEELRDVLARPELQAKFPALTDQRAAVFLKDLLNRGEMIHNVPPTFVLPRDKKDEPYVNLAIAANVQFLVTWNDRHLGYLMKRDTPEGIDFCDRFPSIRIVSPPTFLALVR